MALVLIASPGNAPTQVSDWAKINNVFQSIGLRLGNGRSVAGGFIQRGTVYFIAGAYYAADSDTAITGTASDYVRLTNTAGVITPEYVTNLDGVSWNKTWQGFYDISLSLFIFDEMKAYGSGVIDAPESIKNWRPVSTTAKFLASAIDNEWIGVLEEDPTTATIINAAKVAGIDPVNGNAGTEGSQTIAAGGTWTIPKGTYFFAADTTDIVAANIEIRISSLWRHHGGTGFIISDGINFRVRNTSELGSMIARYRKIA